LERSRFSTNLGNLLKGAGWDSVFLSLFGIFCALEILMESNSRSLAQGAPIAIAFNRILGGYSCFLSLIMAAMVLIVLQSVIRQRTSLRTTVPALLHTWCSKFVACIHVMSIGGILVLNVWLRLGGLLFLTTQMLVLTSLWLGSNRRYQIVLSTQRLSLLSTCIWVLYSLVSSIRQATLNTESSEVMASFVFVYLVTWICLHVLVDIAPYKDCHSESWFSRGRAWLGIRRLLGKVVSIDFGHHEYALMIILVLLISSYAVHGIGSRIYTNAYFPFYGNVFSSSEVTRFGNGSVVLGGLDYAGVSSATWKCTVQILPFMSEQMKQASEAFLAIGGAPISRNAPSISVDSVGWRDENFTEGWTFCVSSGLNESRAVSDGFTYVVSSNLEADRSYYLMSKTVPALSTDEYPFFAVRWKSTARIARVDVEYAVGGPDQCVVGSGRSSDNGYSSEWRTTVFQLSSNRTVKDVILGIDDDYNWLQTSNDVTGPQTVSFSQVMFFSYDKSSQVKITLNDHLVLDASLLFEQNGTYTLSPNKYQTWTLPGTAQTCLKIPLGIDKLRLENSLNITVTEGARWDVSSVVVWIVLYMDAVSPAWRSNVGFIFLIFGFELVLIVILLKRFGLLPKWLLGRRFRFSLRP